MMTTYALVFVLFLVTALFADKLPFKQSLHEINSLKSRILFVFQSKTTSDYRKERLLKWYSLRLFLVSSKILFYILVVILSAFLFLIFVSDVLLKVHADRNVFAFIDTLKGVYVSILAFCFYYLSKKVYARFRL